jgi:hypothetical protein
MICPHCQLEFETAASHCPECGVRIVRKISGVVRTSTVMIAAGDEHTFYRSVQEVPETLRRRLIETTNSENSGMIVIADRAGKQHWTEVVARREAERKQAIAPACDIQEPAPAVSAQGVAGLSWAAWAGILLFLGASATAASVFGVFR